MPQVYMFDNLLVTIDMKTDISAATGKKIFYKKPDGTNGEWTGTVSGTSLTYNAVSGEIDQPGLWQFEGRANVSGRKSSEIITLNVDKPLDA